MEAPAPKLDDAVGRVVKLHPLEGELLMTNLGRVILDLVYQYDGSYEEGPTTSLT